MTTQRLSEVRRVQVRSDYEQHRLLSMIERMSREGRSEDEIVAALHATGVQKAPGTKASRAEGSRSSRNTRPGRDRLARWASARLRA